ncbi:unnamed protein product, partial [Ectocarpus sp. 8 AP-2014]
REGSGWGRRLNPAPRQQATEMLLSLSGSTRAENQQRGLSMPESSGRASPTTTTTIPRSPSNTGHDVLTGAGGGAGAAKHGSMPIVGGWDELALGASTAAGSRAERGSADGGQQQQQQLQLQQRARHAKEHGANGGSFTTPVLVDLAFDDGAGATRASAAAAGVRGFRVGRMSRSAERPQQDVSLPMRSPVGLSQQGHPQQQYFGGIQRAISVGHPVARGWDGGVSPSSAAGRPEPTGMRVATPPLGQHHQYNTGPSQPPPHPPEPCVFGQNPPPRNPPPGRALPRPLSPASFAGYGEPQQGAPHHHHHHPPPPQPP